MANTTYGSPYVQSSDLVSGWPATSLSVADRIDDVSFKGNGVNNQTATYTTVLTDAGKTIVMNVGSANDLTIQASGTAAYETGTMIRVVNKGTGATTVKPAGGVTLNGGNITLAQNQSATVVNIATDIWSPVSTPAAAAASGLTLISTNSYSAASSVIINNCFNSTYDNYLVLMKCSASTALTVKLRLRVGGTDNTANSYTTQRTAANDVSISGARTLDTSFVWANYDSSTLNNTTATIFSPAIAEATTLTSLNQRSTNTSITETFSSVHTVNTAYDGMDLFTTSGTITGTIKIFGYQNS